tara:strand:- start:149 stop:601 length:453 start_codon:yes stop_codon:yes gene_type:complete
VPTTETVFPLSEQGKEKAVPIDPAPKINILVINYSLKRNLLIKYKTATISTLPKIINIIKDDFVKIFKSKKVKLLKPYKEEFTVLVSVSMDNLKEFSNVKLSRVNKLDSINMEIINNKKTKKAILTSSSVIFVSTLYKFLSIMLIGFTKR